MAIRHTLIHKVIEANKEKPFSIVFHKISTGEKVKLLEVVRTSVDYKARTMNVKNLVNGDVRTIRTITITEFNEQEVVY